MDRMEQLKKAQEIMRRKRESGELEILTPIEKAKRNPKSLRLAINAKCWECSNESRVEVKRCHITGCPLWAVRPWQ